MSERQKLAAFGGAQKCRFKFSSGAFFLLISDKNVIYGSQALISFVSNVQVVLLLKKHQNHKSECIQKHHFGTKEKKYFTLLTVSLQKSLSDKLWVKWSTLIKPSRIIENDHVNNKWLSRKIKPQKYWVFFKSSNSDSPQYWAFKGAARGLSGHEMSFPNLQFVPQLLWWQTQKRF